MTTSRDDRGTPENPDRAADELERRAFVRRMTNDAVGAAGRVFGLSKALTRGAIAAGQSMRDSLASTVGDEEQPLPATGQPMSVEAAAAALSPGESAAPSDVAPDTDAGPDPEPAVAVGRVPEPASRVAPAQAAVLAGATAAILAVNGRDGPPLAGPVAIHWDGETIRVASLGWSRRATAIRLDPRVTLVVDDPTSGGYLGVEGTAEFIAGDGARDAMLPLLSRTGDRSEAEARWGALIAEDPDRVVIMIRPARILPGRRT